MGKPIDGIDAELARWIAAQHGFYPCDAASAWSKSALMSSMSSSPALTRT